VARAEVYLHAKFHLDPSNHLATAHERHRQDDNGPIARGEQFYKRSPKKLSSNSNFNMQWWQAAF